MKLGFTGARKGMTAQQQSAIEVLVADPVVTIVHHGDCVGADAEFHDAAVKYDKYVVVHPPSDSKLRAWCQGDEVRHPRPYLERNRRIVDSVDLLVATPNSDEEQERSGTWATIRYARKVGRPVKIVWRDGRVQLDAAS
jgi:hypothetical protein